MLSIMLYISLSLRYYRQLTLICPDVVEGFFKEVAIAAETNGGSVLPQSAGSAYAFDSQSLCYVFSVFLTIEAILSLAEERKSRIKEYFVFVDSTEKKINQEEIADRMSACDNLIFPDRAVVLTEKAAGLLSHYARIDPVPNSSLFCYSGRKGGGKKMPRFAPVPGKIAAIPFPGVEDTGKCGILSALLNAVSAVSLDFNAEAFLTKKEANAFGECKKAVERLAAERFSSQHPPYLMDTCEEYLKLFFTSLSRFCAENRWSETIEIEIPAGIFKKEETARLEALLSDICAFKIEGAGLSQKGERILQADVIDVAAIPSDIMDAAYLFFRASAFLYSGETESFLRFLGKRRPFAEAIRSCFSALGFPQGQAFFRLVQRLADCGLPSEESKKRIDKYLFDYLKSKCESGEIIPCKDFYYRLSTLGIKMPDSFLVAAVYRSPNPAETAQELKGGFSDQAIATAIAEHSEAEKELSRGNFLAAHSDAKRVLQAFQRAKVLSGEFEVFLFLARLSFSRSGASSSDAFSYLDYAFENTAKMRDTSAQMRSLFDFASMNFLAGNFFQAQVSAARLREKASACYDKCWGFVSRFIEGRILFALGDYRACEKAFTSLEALCPSINIERAASLCRAWAFRSAIYCSKKPLTEESLASLCEASPEAAVFALEGIAKSARDKEAMQEAESAFRGLPSEIKDAPVEGIYVSPFEWEWKGSFSFMEDRYFCGMPAGTASILYSALYSFCSALYDGGFAIARDSIADLAASELPSGSPYAYILYYMCYELENLASGKDSLNSLSFLSRAFKGLQLLANNIADSAMREKFLTEPYWNALLYAAARENKLI